MSLPDDITATDGAVFAKTYLPGDGVTQRSFFGSDGHREDIVLIQSSPTKAGRQRHVVRFTSTSAPDAVTKKRDQTTVTVTFDHAVENTDYAGIASTINAIKRILPDAYMTNVIQGQL